MLQLPGNKILSQVKYLWDGVEWEIGIMEV